MEETKREIRMRALARRDALSPAERTAHSKEIINKIVNLDCYRKAAALLVYAHFRSEVETGTLIETALKDNKAVFAPAVTGREMAFFRIWSLEELKSGYQGILEPAQQSETSYDVWLKKLQGENASVKTLLCMPGAAFDRKRNRVGYGGGYYDRWLSARLQERGEGKDDIETLALAFSCQVFAKIPCEPHDLRPERIVTEQEIITDIRNSEAGTKNQSGATECRRR